MRIFKTKVILHGLLIGSMLLLQACQLIQKKSGLVDDIRHGEETHASIIEVYPLTDPAARTLMEQAREYEKNNQLDWAIARVEQALAISPQDPFIMQYLAELKLKKSDYPSALELAQASWKAGPGVGPLCSRNWQTAAAALDHMSQSSEADEARARVKKCRVDGRTRL